jgi:hypothetical protein
LLRAIGRYIRRHHVALLALFVALGGTALALGRNEVKSKHIAPGQVKRSDTSDKLRLKCPARTRYYEGACIETAMRPAPATHINAMSDCRDEGRRLPALAELENFRLEPGIALSGQEEWTSHIFHNGASFRAMTVDEGGFEDDFGTNNDPIPYRCVARAKR